MMEYNEEEFLNLSGIQHFVFCRRQWALIDVEGLWAENLRTVEGDILHEAAHDDGFTEKRGEVLISRGMPVFSRALGVSGACDVVEFRSDPDGVALAGREGRYLPVPIEYKRGSPKEHAADELQLCCQAMCLEEMLLCSVERGYLYYGETRRRQEVVLTEELRAQVRTVTEEMHAYMRKGYTPKVKTGKHCKACSLSELCLPQLMKSRPVGAYIDRCLKGDAP